MKYQPLVSLSHVERIVTAIVVYRQFHLRDGSSAATIAWDAFVALVVAIAGLFLIRRYIVTLDDLRHYKGLEDAGEREAAERRAVAASDGTDKV